MDGIRFEMYSPEENEPVSRQQPGSNTKSKQCTGKDSATRRQEKMDEHDQNLVSSMRSYLVRKKLDFTSNVNGFFERLNETENQLKLQQDQLEKKMDEEQRAEALKIEFEQ